MLGCLRRLGCIVLVLLLLCAVAWFTRDRWYPRLRGATGTAAAPSTAIVWEPLTAEGAERARQAVASLDRRSGPAFATTRPGDISAYVFTGVARQLPPSAEDVRAAAIDDRLYVKALVDLNDFGGGKVLGPLAGFLGDRDTVQLGGDFEILRPGLAQFRVREIRLRELSVPRRLIPRLVAQIRRGGHPEGVADDALPLVVPRSIGDVRVARGRVVLYKTVP
ncbi:MAG: hypothetical protein ACJ79S_05765 [Gemmatimonadaceae bacterium]